MDCCAFFFSCNWPFGAFVFPYIVVAVNILYVSSQRFVVKYLGYRETSDLWGIKHTRDPVDQMVIEAKRSLSANPDKGLALLKLQVDQDGIHVSPMPQNINPFFPKGKFAIENISYGVQDVM